MNILSVIGALLQIVYLILKGRSEKDAEKKALNAQVVKEALDAVDKRDASSLTVAFDRLRK